MGQKPSQLALGDDFREKVHELAIAADVVEFDERLLGKRVEKADDGTFRELRRGVKQRRAQVRLLVKPAGCDGDRQAIPSSFADERKDTEDLPSRGVDDDSNSSLLA